MKIYDCTTFYSERMMLDLRFNILNKNVHKFIIVESSFSHSGEKKIFHFNINDYPKFKDKIIYLIIEKEPETPLKEPQIIPFIFIKILKNIIIYRKLIRYLFIITPTIVNNYFLYEILFNFELPIISFSLYYFIFNFILLFVFTIIFKKTTHR